MNNAMNKDYINDVVNKDGNESSIQMEGSLKTITTELHQLLKTDANAYRKMVTQIKRENRWRS